MLQTIDKALAGAIDVVADDLQATVKSVREQGVMRTFGDAMEDAAGMVKTGATSVFDGMLSQTKGPDKISTHSGVASAYADLCAGSGPRSVGETGIRQAAFPYEPSPSRGAAPVCGTFAPVIGIQRPSERSLPRQVAPFTPAQGGVQVFAKPSAGVATSLGLGSRQPCPPLPEQASTAGTFAAKAQASTAPAPAPGKEPTLEPAATAARFAEILRLDIANQTCFDCGSRNPEWASVSFGIFLCIECCGYHRQMGTHISRMRSCKMDSWTEKQLIIFDHGGNARLAAFFEANHVPSSARQQRYMTPAAEWYREAWIKSRTLGLQVPAPPAGIVAGPCVARLAESCNKAAAAPADLLDLGGAGPTGGVVAHGLTADLISFDSEPVSAACPTTTPSVDSELFDFGSNTAACRDEATRARDIGGGDLLDLGSMTPRGSGPATAHAAEGSLDSDLLGFSSVSTSPSTRPPTDRFASVSLDGSPLLATAPAVGAFPIAAPTSEARATVHERVARNSIEPAEDTTVQDPLALALQNWGM